MVNSPSPLAIVGSNMSASPTRIILRMASRPCQRNCRKRAHPLEQDFGGATRTSGSGPVARLLCGAHAGLVHAGEVEPSHLNGEDLDRWRGVAQPADLDTEGLALAVVPGRTVDLMRMCNALDLQEVR